MKHSFLPHAFKPFVFACFLSIISFIGCSCSEGTTVTPSAISSASWLYPDSACLSVFQNGEDSLLFYPDTIKCYRLSYLEPDSATNTVLKGFVRDSCFQVLDEKQEAILQYILLSNSLNYSNDTVVMVQSPNIPELEFEFSNKESISSISLVISLTDMSWMIIQKDSICCNYNYTDPSIVNRFCQIFLSK